MNSITATILVLLISLGCAIAIEYPYEAPAERQALIRKQFSAIKVGMTSKDVVKLIGKPDKITPLYEPKIKNSKQIGSTMWYVLSQSKKHGSVNEVKKVALAIRLNLNNVISRIDGFSFP
jgi:outer membrane protein assembly factor BamE (lipoprotein component of BamABCDE complex)